MKESTLNPFEMFMLDQEKSATQTPEKANSEHLNRIVSFIDESELQLQHFIKDSLKKIILLRGNKILNDQFQEFITQTKLLENGLKNICKVYFELLRDSEYLRITLIEEVEQQVRNYKKCLNRTIDAYNRVSSQPVNKYGECKVQRKKSGRNCKIGIESTAQLQKWLLLHFHHPYPSVEERQQMSKKSGLNENQVNNWFINLRERTIKKISNKDPKQYQKPNRDQPGQANSPYTSS